MTVLARDGDQPLSLMPKPKRSFWRSIAEADRGETVDSDVVLQGLRDQE